MDYGDILYVHAAAAAAVKPLDAVYHSELLQQTVTDPCELHEKAGCSPSSRNQHNTGQSFLPETEKNS